MQVVYGSAREGIVLPGSQLWHQDIAGVEGVVEERDRFGFALAAGDFDGDGYDDLAIGVPGESVEGIYGAGAVNVLYGTNVGLAVQGDAIFHQGVPGVNTNGVQVEGVAEPGDAFGWSLAAGDFNGDGYDDLAVGVGSEDVGDIGFAGAVNVILGAPGGLTANGSQIWHQDSPGIVGVPEFDGFGRSLAAGDFDGNGYDDLAIGVPYESVLDVPVAGAVNVIYGSASGLGAEGNQILHQALSGSSGLQLAGTAEDGDGFGWSLAVGNFNGDQFDDLAIGVLNEGVKGGASAGAVNLVYGSRKGLNKEGNYIIRKSDDVLTRHLSVHENDWFGGSLAAGDITNDGFDDLAVGIPGQHFNGHADVGAVATFFGKPSYGLIYPQVWSQKLDVVPGAPEAGDRFGSSVAMGDFTGNGHDDFAAGVPAEDTGSIVDAGAVNVIYPYGGFAHILTQAPPSGGKASSDASGTAGIVATYNESLVADGPEAAETESSAQTAPSDGRVEAFELHGNYPNPFNPQTTIRFALPEAASVRLAVYDLLGRQVRLLVDGSQPAGVHEVRFDGAGLPSGTYLYRLDTSAGSFTERMLLLK